MENVCPAGTVRFPEIHIPADFHVLESATDGFDHAVLVVSTLVFKPVAGDGSAVSVFRVIVGFDIVRKDVTDIEDSDRQVGYVSIVCIENIMIVYGRIYVVLGLGQ